VASLNLGSHYSSKSSNRLAASSTVSPTDLN
jgi:hypothetical protein